MLKQKSIRPAMPLTNSKEAFVPLHLFLFLFSIASSISHFVLFPQADLVGYKLLTPTLLALTIVVFLLSQRNVRFTITSADLYLLFLMLYSFVVIPFGRTSLSESFATYTSFFMGALAYGYARLSYCLAGSNAWVVVTNAFLAGAVIQIGILSLQMLGVSIAYFDLNVVDSNALISESRGLLRNYFVYRYQGIAPNPTYSANFLSTAFIIYSLGSASLIKKIVFGIVFIFFNLSTGSVFPTFLSIFIVFFIYRSELYKWVSWVFFALFAYIFIEYFGIHHYFYDDGYFGWYRMEYIFFSGGWSEFLFGRIYGLGNQIPLGIQTGAWLQGEDLQSIFDSLYLWIFYQFGLFGFVLLITWFAACLKCANASGDNMLVALVLYIILLSIKHYQLNEKMVFVFNYFVLGVAVNSLLRYTARTRSC